MKIIASAAFVLLVLTGVFAQTTDEGQKFSVEAVRLFNAGKYDEALPLAKQAVATREKNLGHSNILVGRSLRNLAFIEQRLGDKKEAGNAFNKALSIYEKNQPLSKSDETALAELLETSAYFVIADGTISKSIPMFQEAIALRKKSTESMLWRPQRH